MVPETRFVIIWRLHSDMPTLQAATLFRECRWHWTPGTAMTSRFRLRVVLPMALGHRLRLPCYCRAEAL